MFVRTTEPTHALVSLSEAKDHLRVSIDADDDLITALVEAATQRWEAWCRRSFRLQTWSLHLPEFPTTDDGSLPAIELAYPPLRGVALLKYTDTDGNEQTLVEGTDFKVWKQTAMVGVVSPAYSKSWPSTREEPEAVRLTFTTGYLNAAESPAPTPTPPSAPAKVAQAIKLTVGHWYENREEELIGTVSKSLPNTGKMLMRSLRIPEIR